MRNPWIQRLIVVLLLSYLAPIALFAGMPSTAGPRVTAAALMAPDVPLDRLQAVERAVADAKGSADNSWMLASSALVPLFGADWKSMWSAPLVEVRARFGIHAEGAAAVVLP